MEIQRTGITQVWLLPLDLIHVETLIHRPTLQRLGKLFEFNDAEVAESPSGERAINLVHGVFMDEGEVHTIRLLILEQRKVTLAMDGSSADADAAYAQLADFLSETSGLQKAQYLEPILKSEESHIICRLDFPVSDFFAPEYLNFVEKEIVAAASSKTVQAGVKPLSLKFRVEYEQNDASLKDYRIALSPKEFVLEPRVGTPLSDQIYYSKAPVDTETHRTLLEGLESKLAPAQE